MPELRKDPVVGRWVIISTERARRPSDFAAEPVRPRADRVRVLRRPRAPDTAGDSRGPPARRSAERAGLDLSRRAEQISGAPDRGRAGARGRRPLRPDERRRRARGRHRDAAARRVARRALGRRGRRRALRVPRAHARSEEGSAVRLRPRVQESRRGRRRLAGASALAAHRHADHPDHGVRGARGLGPVLRPEGALCLV